MKDAGAMPAKGDKDIEPEALPAPSKAQRQQLGVTLRLLMGTVEWMSWHSAGLLQVLGVGCSLLQDSGHSQAQPGWGRLVHTEPFQPSRTNRHLPQAQTSVSHDPLRSCAASTPPKPGIYGCWARG